MPAGVINVVPGYGHQAGAALAAHPDINRMSFTGSPESREGGYTVDHSREHLKRFVETAKVYLEETQIGYGLDPETQMGPLVSEKQRRRVLGFLEDGEHAGVEAILRGGEVQVSGHQGFYVRPSLLAGKPDNRCAVEEIFEPVAYLMQFRDEDESLELVNRSNYGLANSVWTADLNRARRVAESMVAGNSWINAHNVFKHGIPYGGCNLSGLGGGVLGPDTFFDYLRQQSIVRPV